MTIFQLEDVKTLTVEAEIDGEPRTIHMVAKISINAFANNLMSKLNRSFAKEKMMYTKAFRY